MPLGIRSAKLRKSRVVGSSLWIRLSLCDCDPNKDINNTYVLDPRLFLRVYSGVLVLSSSVGTAIQFYCYDVIYTCRHWTGVRRSNLGNGPSVIKPKPD